MKIRIVLTDPALSIATNYAIKQLDSLYGSIEYYPNLYATLTKDPMCNRWDLITDIIQEEFYLDKDIALQLSAEDSVFPSAFKYETDIAKEVAEILINDGHVFKVRNKIFTGDPGFEIHMHLIHCDHEYLTIEQLN